jgi:hypothetical protein
MGSGFLYIDVFGLSLAELQLITAHCVNSSRVDSLFSSLLLVPIRCLVRVLLPRLLFTRH